jgi:hypothetical protein
MKRILTIQRAVGFVAVFSSAIAAQPAAAATNAAESAKFLAPFLDEQTLAVVQVDLTRATPKAAFDRWVEMLPETERSVAGSREFWTHVHEALTRAGANEVYAVISLADVPVRPPMFVVPKPARGQTDSFIGDLTAALKEVPKLQIADGDAAVTIASREGLARLGQHRPAVHPELEQALAAAGDHAIRVAVVPTDDDRRVVNELLPTLPELLGGVPSTVLTRGVQWLAVGADVGMPALAITAQSTDEPAAREFVAGWGRALAALAASDGPSLSRLAEALKVFEPKVIGDRVAVNLNAAQTRAALLAAQAPIREVQMTYWREQNSNRLKQIVLGALNHESARGEFPPAFSQSEDGKPLLSWRVHILPFMEEIDLWRQFHLDEPWDSPHNKALIPKMPEVFRSPASRHVASDGLSTYREVVGPNTALQGGKGLTWKQLVDGSSNTVLVVDVDDEHAQIWTKPGGLPFDAQPLSAGMGGQFPEGIMAAFCDGHFSLLKNPPVDEKMLRALFTIDGGELVNW